MQSESAVSVIMTATERQALEMVVHDRFWCLLCHQEFGQWNPPTDCVCGAYQEQASSYHQETHIFSTSHQETQIPARLDNKVAVVLRSALADSSLVYWSNKVASLVSICMDLVLAQVDQALQPIMAQLLHPSENKAFGKDSTCVESEDAVEQLQEQVMANRKRRQELMQACQAVGRELIGQEERDQVGLHLLPVEVLDSMVGRPVSTASRRFKNHRCEVAGGWYAMYHDKVVAQLLDDIMIVECVEE